MHSLLSLLKNSKRPVIVAGGGIRLADAVEDFRDLIAEKEIPVVSTLMGIDLLEAKDFSYMGHAGTKGQRSANMVVQEADLIISIGSRLCISFVGHDPRQFAPQAKKIVVDVDRNEHSKKTIKIDLFLKTDAKEFINKLRKLKYPQVDYNWQRRCIILKSKYFNFNETPMYRAVTKITELSKPGDVYTTGSGVTAFAVAQTIRIKKNQRSIIPGTLTMGYGLCAAIGVWAANPKAQTIAIIGDGSLQLNIQELQTIVHHKIPAKIFVINNEGYLAIRTTQKNNFGNFIGESKDSGISFPNTKKIAKAYNIHYTNSIKVAMKYDDTVICEIFTPKWQPHLTVMFGKPNSEMFPPIK